MSELYCGQRGDLLHHLPNGRFSSWAPRPEIPQVSSACFHCSIFFCSSAALDESPPQWSLVGPLEDCSIVSVGFGMEVPYSSCLSLHFRGGIMPCRHGTAFPFAANITSELVAGVDDGFADVLLAVHPLFVPPVDAPEVWRRHTGHCELTTCSTGNIHYSSLRSGYVLLRSGYVLLRSSYVMLRDVTWRYIPVTCHCVPVAWNCCITRICVQDTGHCLLSSFGKTSRHTFNCSFGFPQKLFSG